MDNNGQSVQMVQMAHFDLEVVELEKESLMKSYWKKVEMHLVGDQCLILVGKMMLCVVGCYCCC